MGKVPFGMRKKSHFGITFQVEKSLLGQWKHAYTIQNKIKPVDDSPSAYQDLWASPNQYLGNLISLCNVTTATRGWGSLALRREYVHLDSHLRHRSVHDLNRERVVDHGSLVSRCLICLIIIVWGCCLIIGCLSCGVVVFVAVAASVAVFLLLFYVVTVK